MLDVNTTMLISAPPAEVWRAITDLGGHDAWNPLMRRFSGGLEPGGRIRFSIRLGPVWLPVSARVMTVDAERELRWAGPALSAAHPLARGEHWFRLSADADGGTRFDHGERWSGLVPRALWRVIGPPLHEGYEAMNRALARRVQAG